MEKIYWSLVSMLFLILPCKFGSGEVAVAIAFNNRVRRGRQIATAAATHDACVPGDGCPLSNQVKDW